MLFWDERDVLVGFVGRVRVSDRSRWQVVVVVELSSGALLWSKRRDFSSTAGQNRKSETIPNEREDSGE